MEVRTVACAAAPTPEQTEVLKEVMQAFNAACNFVSGVAREHRVFNQIALHHLTYHTIRERFVLPAQLAVRAIAKVADAYKTNQATQVEFRPLGAITYYTGGLVRGLRKRHLKLRRRLQAKGTKAAKRLLRKRRRKEARFQRHVNHCISKQIVAAAKGTGRGVAVEDLTHIRSRITARKSQRSVLSAWAFHQLRFLLAYKCADAGLPLVAVDPRNTSRTCLACGCIDKRNRPSQSEFKCVQCGLHGHADLFAAENIRRAAVSQPDCSVRASGQPGQMPAAAAAG
jgi:IS605 OrfB family transposase